MNDGSKHKAIFGYKLRFLSYSAVQIKQCPIRPVVHRIKHASEAKKPYRKMFCFIWVVPTKTVNKITETLFVQISYLNTFTF